MIIDRYQFRTSTPSPMAAADFADATASLAAHRPATGAALERALAQDPHHIGALALKGFGALILAKSELRPVAAAALARAQSAIERGSGGTEDECLLVDALDHAVEGRFGAAVQQLDAGFCNRPTTLLPFKISQSLRFMLGDAAGLLTHTRQMMRDWTPLAAGAGYLLGCHAFALEECGHFEEAERFGRRAVAIQPDDAWGRHAVAHVHYMRGEVGEGIEWMERGHEHWSRCNNFSFHMAWHLALLHLERGEHDHVLKLYDEEVRPLQTDDFRDMANAVSLLARLNVLGVDVGARWDNLAEVARSRRTDTTVVFGLLHTLVALRAVSDFGSMRVLVQALREKAAGDDDQSRVARDVGCPLAEIIAGMSPGISRELDRLALSLSRLGGSNAQRDLFMLGLADAAAATTDVTALRSIAVLRSRLKAEDSLIAAVEARALALRAGGSFGQRRGGASVRRQPLHRHPGATTSHAATQ